MSGHQTFDKLKQKLSATQLRAVEEKKTVIEQDIIRIELEIAIKSSISAWEPNSDESAIDRIDDCLSYLRKTVNTLGGELNITAKFPNDVEVVIDSIKN